MTDWLNQNYFDGKPPKAPATPGRKRKKHDVPERDKLFAAQKNAHKALQQVRDLQHGLRSLPPKEQDKIVGSIHRLNDHVERAYKQLRSYLEDHTEAR